MTLARNARGEFELDLSRFGVEQKVRIKEAVRLCRAEPLDEVRLFAGKHFLYVVDGNFLAEDYLVQTETCFGLVHKALRNISGERIKDRASINRRFAELFAEFDFFGVRIVKGEFDFSVFENKPCGKFHAALGAESGQRTDLFICQKFDDFFVRHFTATENLANLNAVFGFKTGDAFVNLATVDRAEGGLFLCVFFFETADVRDHFGGEVFDALHEFDAGFFALFNLGKLIFPFTGEFRRS